MSVADLLAQPGENDENEISRQIQQAVDSHGGVFDNLRDLIRAGGPAEGGGLLDGILGRSKPDVQSHVEAPKR